MNDAVGVTVVLLTCSYRTKEFIRVGYYVNNEYNDPELKENPPSTPQYDNVSIYMTNHIMKNFLQGFHAATEDGQRLEDWSEKIGLYCLVKTKALF